jgi:hypothetical protein
MVAAGKAPAMDGRHRSYLLARDDREEKQYFFASPGKRSPGRMPKRTPPRHSGTLAAAVVEHQHHDDDGNDERIERQMPPRMAFSSASISTNDILNVNDAVDGRQPPPSSEDDEGGEGGVLLDRRDDYHHFYHRQYSRERERERERERDIYTKEGEPICDYDTSATELYELLESSAWERARSRCRSHPEEVKTWIVRKDAATTVRWKLLPLHASIIFQSPNYLVSAILEQYPAAAQRQDDQQMLPLHLAFRHKHEDEDLLELLLVKYPKAVMLKDRRDRVPLEHARDAKFSAKLMRLYADAVTAASRLVGTNHHHTHPATPTTLYSHESMLTAGERALLIKDHKDELLAVKQAFEKQIKSLKASTSDQVHNIEDDADKRIEMLRNDYETQIRNLKDHHEGHLRKLITSNQKEITDIRDESDAELRRTSQEHADELQHLRAKLDEQMEHDAALAESLERDIAELHFNLQDCLAERDFARSESEEHQQEVLRLCELLTAIQAQHNDLSDMLQMQKQDHESAKQIRNELVQTLLRLEEQEGKGQHIVGMTDVIHKLRRKIDASLERTRANMRAAAAVTSTRAAANTHAHAHAGYLPKSPYKHPPIPRNDRLAESKSPRSSPRASSRKEVQVQRDPSTSPRHSPRRQPSPAAHSHQHSVPNHNRSPSRLERAREERALLHRSGPPRQPSPNKAMGEERWERQGDNDHDDGDYGEVRILADEISAITDTSDH